ncbi:uncharacterized mitochondrial protein-like protein, partial [Tanacetum coccineum]
MSTQQAIYVVGSETRPPMLNKENYVTWSSRLLRYAKSRPNRKLIYNSIMNGLYVRRMIPEPGDADREVPVNETFHEQTDEELTKKELKQDLHTTDYTQLYDFLKYNQKEVDDLRAELLAKTDDPLALMENSNLSIIQYPTTAMNMAPVLMAKAFKLNYSTPTNNNQRISLNPRNKQIAQSGMNLGQDRQMQMVGVQNVRNQVVQNAVQNLGVQNVRNQNGLIVVPEMSNQNPNLNGNGNVVAARAEGNVIGNNGNQIRCYNCRGLGHLTRNCIVRLRRMDAAYLQTQLLIAQKEKARIQLQAEEFDLIAAAGDLDEIKEVNANYILMA